MTWENFKVEVTEGIGLVTVNRPEVHNALSQKMWRDLPGCLSQCQKDGAKVLVITGEGASFVSGADLCELKSIENLVQAEQNWKAIRDALQFVANFPLPTFAMVNGACIGGGCLLALACDLRFASRTATFGIPVARLGIILDDANVRRLLCLVGPAFAKEILFSANTISALRAEEIGLINGLVELNELKSFVINFAKGIAQNASDAVLELKAAFLKASLAEVSDNNEVKVVQSYLSTEFRNRIRTIFEP